MHQHHDRLTYDEVSPGRHRATCTCGEWHHERHVDLRNERDRLDAEAAWSEHHLVSMGG
jgi:hypothetical protein